MRFACFAIFIVLISGCSTLAERQAADARFVGKPEAELSRVMDACARARVGGRVMFQIYEDRRLKTVPGALFCFGLGPLFDSGGFPPSRPATLACDPRFTVNGGVVRAFNLGSNGCAQPWIWVTESRSGAGRGQGQRLNGPLSLQFVELHASQRDDAALSLR